MSENSSKAYLNYQRGRQKLYPGCCSALFSNTEERIEEAINCFKEAGDLYILDKNYAEAAKCFNECGLIKQSNKENPCEYYEQALTCYKKIKDYQNWNDTLIKLIDNNLTFASFNYSGKYCMQKAELDEFLQKNNDAMNDYDNALNFFQMDKSSLKSDIAKCSLKKADLLILKNNTVFNEDIIKAMAIYEEIGEKNKENNGMSSFVINGFFKNVICNLYYKDVLNAIAYLHKFQENCLEFKNSNEGVFLSKLIKLFQGEDEEVDLISVNNLNDLYQENKSNLNNIETEWLNLMMINLEEKIKEINKQKPNFAEDEDFK